MAFKMKAGKEGPMKKNFGSMISSPMDKELVGNQKNLPEHLKKKIEAAPESPNKKGKMKTKTTDGKRKTKVAVKEKGENSKEPTMGKTETRNDLLEPTIIGRTYKEQRKIDSQYRRGKRQGHDKRTINERMKKGMDYLRKVKLPAKKTTKLDVTESQDLMGQPRTKKQKRKDFKTMKREQKRNK